MDGKAIDPAEFPVSIIFRFRTEAEKNAFLGGLIDGFGENHCRVGWPWKGAADMRAYAFREFTVTMPDEASDGEGGNG